VIVRTRSRQTRYQVTGTLGRSAGRSGGLEDRRGRGRNGLGNRGGGSYGLGDRGGPERRGRKNDGDKCLSQVIGVGVLGRRRLSNRLRGGGLAHGLRRGPASRTNRGMAN
jgi:hypothetical protein